MLDILMLHLCWYRGAKPLEWNLRAARDYHDMTAHQLVAGNAMPHLEALVGDPRSPLTKVERDLALQFPGHQLGDVAIGKVNTEAHMSWRP
jgi:hypothetical protein